MSCGSYRHKIKRDIPPSPRHFLQYGTAVVHDRGRVHHGLHVFQHDVSDMFQIRLVAECSRRSLELLYVCSRHRSSLALDLSVSSSIGM